jgi:hypothetical protein
MSASSSIQIKAARSSETWINILLDYTAGYPVSQYSSICITVAHQIMAVVLRNFNNKHRLNKDFSISVNGLHTVESQTSIVMPKDNDVRNDCTISQATPKR